MDYQGNQGKDRLLRGLADLGNRERQILELVCQGIPYKEIADTLAIADSTVGSTMTHVYIKLGLSEENLSAKRKVLFREVCHLLDTVELPAPPPDPDIPDPPVPDEVMRMVEEDGWALVPVPQETVAVEGEVIEGEYIPASPPARRPGRGWRCLGYTAIIIAILCAAGGVMAVVATLAWPALGLDNPVREVLRLALGVETQVALSPPTQPAQPPPTLPPTAVPDAPTQPAPTNTPHPTDTPPPTMTAIPMLTATPEGMVDEVYQVSGEESGTATGDGGQAADSSWYSSGVYVQAGDRLSVTYLGGEWWVGRTQNNEWWPQTPTDAGGYTGREGDRALAELMVNDPNLCYELRSAPIGSLIGRIGESGPAFSIGNDYDEVVQLTGILFLRINYNSRVNYAFHFEGECPITNGGMVTVRVQVTPR